MPFKPAKIELLNPKEFILIKGAKIHNLKNLDIAIPRNKLVVITGLSGSGKSSLAFDTLYAEGQRRYVESLSSYARQFLGRIHKPEVDYIKGISPAIAIEQKTNTRNPRSTVGTSTEIYDYLKLLFARIGKTFSPVSGEEVHKDSVSDVVNYVNDLKEDTKIILLSPVNLKNNTAQEKLQLLLQQGFSRIKYKNEMLKTDELLKKNISPTADFSIVIDRLVVKKNDEENSGRIADSVQTAFYEGDGECSVEIQNENAKKEISKKFSNRFEADGMTFEEPGVHFFSFNNPVGACKTCEGFGTVIGIDENLVIPNKSLSVYEEAIVCWRGEKMSEWKNLLVKNAHKFDFPVHRAYADLSEAEKKVLWTGNKYFKGLTEFFKFIESESYKIQYRVMLSRYRGKTICPECNGSRLRKDASYIKINGASITDIVLMPVSKIIEFFSALKINEHDQKIAKRLLLEINNRLQFLSDVGLGYLTLNRLSNTLSGGESQRINLATSLGSSLVGSLYILDEPSIGLHPRDTQRLIKVLKSLRNIGNTVIVVEHDEEIMRAADELIDIGPLAGINGGELIFQGNHADILKEEKSLTALYLNGKEKITIPKRRKWQHFIEVKGARENNLKNVSVKFPLNVMTVITGVSGSGKSSLVKSVLYPALKKHFSGYGEQVGMFDKLSGNIELISNIEFIDQHPIGRSSRSNPVTYVKAYDEIRTLYSEQALSKIRAYKPSFFSFNVDGGRCEVCEGEGEIKVEMQFMADIHLECEACKGRRFKSDLLEVEYRQKNIADILDLSVDEAVEFFGSNEKQTTLEKKIVTKLLPLQKVGLGYVKLGQSSSTLSGGEAQRTKLASFLSHGTHTPATLFVFDEPTTGLHFHDIKKLLDAFNALVENGHTLVIIEHNSEIIKSADWIIDIGKEGGDAGGNIVFEGTPEALVKCTESYTGQYLKEKLN